MIELPPESRRELATSFGKGDVLFWEKYEFRDPKEVPLKDSFIIFLTECIQSNSFYIVRGTANVELYKNVLGRYRDIFVLRPQECPFFPKETILDFALVEEIGLDKIVDSLSIRARHIGKLPPDILNRLNKAIGSSKIVERFKKVIILKSRESNL